MITFWQQENGKLVKCEDDAIDPKRKLWVDARSVTREDIRVLEDEYGVQKDHILDILDQDELSRIEKDDDYVLIIMRLPVFEPANDISYFTIPLGIIFLESTIITICWTDCEVLKDISTNRIRNLRLNDFPAFTIQIMNRADSTFLRYLKEINRRSATIQTEMLVSIKNTELIHLLNLEKSLVFFTTSLKSNQLLLEKISKTRLISLDADDKDWLEDVEIDNRQAIEMADTYSDILAGMTEAFASVISNNMNIVMKRLTVISLVMAVPTLITSFFGMNVPLPFEKSGWIGCIAITIICLIAAVAGWVLIDGKNAEHRQKKMPRRSRRRRSAQSE